MGSYTYQSAMELVSASTCDSFPRNYIIQISDLGSISQFQVLTCLTHIISHNEITNKTVPRHQAPPKGRILNCSELSLMFLPVMWRVVYIMVKGFNLASTRMCCILVASPIALTTIPAHNRTFPALSEEEMLSLLHKTFSNGGTNGESLKIPKMQTFLKFFFLVFLSLLSKLLRDFRSEQRRQMIMNSFTLEMKTILISCFYSVQWTDASS